jgi:vitamin B12 transporter
VADDTLFFTFEDQVTITATRIPTLLTEAPAPTDVFTARDIARLPVQTVSELVSLSPGATMRDYGGTGALQLASLRGIGAEYTLVLLNGLRLNGAQNASVDLGQLSLRQVDHIEIARGGFAALYGSNALGGVINIVTTQQAVRPSLQVGYGAFGWKHASISAGEQGRAGRAYAEFRYEEAENDYTFTPTWNSDERTRRNANMLRRAVTAGGTLLLSDASLSVYTDLHSYRTGTPGAVLSSSQGRARQNDDAGLISAQLDWQLDAKRILRVGVGGQLARQEYNDPAFLTNGEALHSRYDTRRISASAVIEQQLFTKHRLSVGMEAAQDVLESEYVQGTPTRLEGAVFAAGYIHTSMAGIPVRIFPSLRWDGMRDNIDNRELSEVMPSIGLHAALLPKRLTMRARWSRSFSTPTFNQLYWSEGGNPELRPEYASAWEGGLVFTGTKLLTSAELTYFSHDITDKIVWAPDDGVYWTPRNVQHVLSKGVEAAAQLRFLHDRIALRVSGQWMSARKMNASFPGDITEGKQLIYVPEWSGAALLGVSITDALSLSATLRILGERFYSESNDASLPAHGIVDIAVTGGMEFLGMRTEGKLELRNCFDADYDVVAYYPMPGRHARATITTTMH